MGPTFDPFWVLNNPNAEDFHVDNLSLPEPVTPQRMSDRSKLLTDLGRGLRSGREPSLSAIDDFQSRAFELLTSDAAQKAFDLDQETPEMRARYGRNIYGQSTLLARRLVEAGTRFVTLSWAPDANATWDTHGDNFNKLKKVLLPEFDAACSSLLQDLDERGLLERTLVCVLGDFGRTPKINANAGRDHWNSCYTVMLAGGGVRQGFVYGASDRTGSVPAESPVSPGDVMATIYRLLGIKSTTQILDALGRPHEVVPQGRVISEIMG
jgi:arylsulfatase A-like enzyme